MPSFESIVDQLRIDLAPNEIEKARAEGFIQGKKYARIEILKLTLALTLLLAVLFLFS